MAVKEAVGKVVSMEAHQSQPDPELVKCLESLLERAKSGELRSLVYLGFQWDKAWESGNVGDLQSRQFVLGCFVQAALDFYTRRREGDG